MITVCLMDWQYLINDLQGTIVLQICSGKLFQNDIEYRNSLRGVIYTNLKLFGDDKIETLAGGDSTNITPSFIYSNCI
ncbi:hypothetical protein VCRA2116O372_70066 [Vibrio crassostreae]|nr:hypothetical protein VCRA2116O372_70066 [Vibrio crassostreae]CAK2554665.1 hypothetical protein VCRA2116O374_60128 [Vibrio crassostreae]CAK2561116.1 hypothetical protein VCRA2117O377_70128 [Vibrio crassostreae]CAK2883676.1 hypothetical protein VCRA2134O405_20304 [Vibrio crassostreae]CAK3375514.1 hypothetical protein VCRA2123O393_20065 [Vibrio crassostreae]